eukprot:55748-Eustigmatos_ZCMA.PRE.4
MAWEVEATDEFNELWESFTEAEQIDIAASIGLLEQVGPNLRHPYSSGINDSKHSHMRELRVQHQGRPYRFLYAFDPRRIAILLIGGDKTGNDRWYKEFIPKADELYDQHLKSLER